MRPGAQVTFIVRYAKTALLKPQRRCRSTGFRAYDTLPLRCEDVRLKPRQAQTVLVENNVLDALDPTRDIFETVRAQGSAPPCRDWLRLPFVLDPNQLASPEWAKRLLGAAQAPHSTYPSSPDRKTLLSLFSHLA